MTTDRGAPPATGWGGWALLAFTVIGVLSLSVLEADYRQARRELEQVVAATDNLLAARLAIAQAHLAWERREGGDPTFGRSRSIAELDVASGRLSDLLDGQSSSIGFAASALEEGEARQLASTLRARSGALRQLLLTVGSDLDPVELRLRFGALDNEAAELQYRVQEALGERLAFERRRHLGLLGAWTLFLALAGGGIWMLLRRARQARSAARVAEAEKASVEARYASLRTLMDAGVLRVDVDGRVVEATRWWERLLGLREAEWAGRPWWEILASEDRKRVATMWRAQARARAAFNLEVRVEPEDRDERWLTGRWRPVEVGKGGSEGSWVGTFLDVTEQRSIEAQLRQAQKLEAVGQMTGGIAHDFNNLLTVVLSNVQLFRLEEGDRSGSIEDMLDDIERAAKNGRELVARLTNFSRRSELSIESVDLAHIVRESMKLGERLLPSDVHLEVRAETGPVVAADARSIQQALLNLVSNARDAMPHGGRLIIQVDDVETDEESIIFEPWVEPGHYGRITVTDTGVGMDRETLSRIFEPFFTTKGEGKGTGLGLASVHGIMRQHGGHTHAYSEPGQGTTFRLYLPMSVDRPAASAKPRRTGELPSKKSLRILLVEDDHALRRTARAVLVRFGHQVEVARNGLEALGILSRDGALFDLVVSDIAMDGIDGIELHSRVRRSGSTIPFLFTSGRGEARLDKDDRVPSDAVFVPKPWSMADLKAAIERAMVA